MTDTEGCATAVPYKQPVARRMDWTDIHYRQLARLISKHTWLYTEMIVDQTVLHAEPKDKYASFSTSSWELLLL